MCWEVDADDGTTEAGVALLKTQGLPKGHILKVWEVVAACAKGESTKCKCKENKKKLLKVYAEVRADPHEDLLSEPQKEETRESEIPSLHLKVQTVASV